MKQANEQFEGKLVQIYIIENDGGYIKIGVSTNVEKRLEMLSGSNGGGHKITRSWISPQTWLYTMEKVLHNHFSINRIEGTEWFEDVKFEDVVSRAKGLFSSEEYQLCNKAREIYYKEQLKLNMPEVQMDYERC